MLRQETPHDSRRSAELLGKTRITAECLSRERDCHEGTRFGYPPYSTSAHCRVAGEFEATCVEPV